MQTSMQTKSTQEVGFSTPRGNRTRLRILELSLDFATRNGLEGLTIGRLAKETGMSKSGLFAHFGSKEELQLATVAEAAAHFSSQVLEPTARLASGIVRLHALVNAWIDHVERGDARGGCFFAAASAEFDGRPGAVRDRLVALTRSWLDLLEEESREARARGELLQSVDPALMAFALHGYAQEANWARQLLDDPKAFVKARRAVDQRIRGFATEQGLAQLSPKRKTDA